MLRDELSDLASFLVVAEECTFTRAAARLSTSQLISTLRPAFSDIDNRLQSLSQFRDKPAGTIRITAGQHSADTLIWPAIDELLREYPDINVELSVDSAFSDIVSGRFDAGIRLGEQVAQDMIAIRIGPELRMAVVGTPEYFSRHPTPKEPHDLIKHSCINIRMPSSGGLYAWEFSQQERELNVRVNGQFVVNSIDGALKAAESGLGLTMVMEDMVEHQLNNGKLRRVLEDWCEPFAGYHIYYPSRRLLSPAFQLLLQILRRRNIS